ncbi:DUF6323 family protein [Desulforamulus ferrireducens]|uniref:Uncharacterized protein n=1 Tax=Desulforamulus ferrireducens TaxID=1833852 RepID=A0A1S6IVV7_9FIRM|nr:DUF6323 family protein [Desulforamulus ferrireducens]AQS58906.1 hypothetical protein B0537_07300 [Desulforamulus ferrireducens]
MSFQIIAISSDLLQKQAAADLLKCNEFTAPYGLVLSYREAAELVETRTLALINNGRIELGGGAMERIIRQFCDSPYLNKNNYVETLHDLTEIFYYYKNETLDLISDEDLIKFMRNSFNGVCQGSLDLLAGRELANLAKNLRFGYGAAAVSDLNEWEDEDGAY